MSGLFRIPIGSTLMIPSRKTPGFVSFGILQKTFKTLLLEKLPKIFFLSCDAFGVLPPLSKLGPEQAVTRYTLGYASSRYRMGYSGTSGRIFGLFWSTIYAFAPDGLRSFIRTKNQENNAQVWLVNTGWIKGPYGWEGIALRYTRALIDAILEDQMLLLPLQAPPFLIFKFLILS